MSTKKKEVKVVIDLDKGIEIYNEKNPEKRQMSRSDIYEIDGITRPTIQNWKKGKVPKALVAIFEFMDKAECNIWDIIEVKKE